MATFFYRGVIFLIAFLSCVVLVAPVGAATLSISDVEVGKVIEMSGQKFVKTGDDPDKGSQFVALEILPTFERFADGMAMEDFTTEMCARAATPTGTDYFPIGTLVDGRDGKEYEVRKFADGKCWMVDNLAYGGAVDACVNKIAFDGCGDYGLCEGVSKSGSVWGYGDCRDNLGYGWGYLYNWQAAVQSDNAYYNTDYQPPEPTQGICPAGWHLPTGDANGEFAALDIAVGGNGGYRSCAPNDASCNFWLPGGNWKGVASGQFSDDDPRHDGIDELWAQGFREAFWTSTQTSSSFAYNFDAFFDWSNYDYVDVMDYWDKSDGYAIRCVKDTCPVNTLPTNNGCVTPETIMPGCSASDGSVCTACSSEYALHHGSCTQITNCTAYDGIGCTACEAGYGLYQGNCVDTTETMQTFTAAECSALPVPSANNFTQGPYLMDERDGKIYEVRKFADGKCWMVDNLAYGGEVDACANNTTFAGEASASASAWGYGACRNNPGSPTYGYLYDWQAAVQDAAAYLGNDYQPTQPTQGICPAGWHVPFGVNGGEFANLNRANGGIEVDDGYYYCDDDACDFWQFEGAWKGATAGFYMEGQGLVGQGDAEVYWSSAQNDVQSADVLVAGDMFGMAMVTYAPKIMGVSVRCIKDACPANTLPAGDGSCVAPETAMTGCTAANGTTCTACSSEYALRNGVCTQLPNCTTYDGIDCTACNDGYTLHQGECVETLGTMQDFEVEDCAVAATPTGADYTAIGMYEDERDGKVYEIRKFADGNCWMVDNLAYGGETDECASKVTFDGCGDDDVCDGASKSGNAWGYGDCRDPKVLGDSDDDGANDYCATGAGAGKCGYLYNWQAVVQDANAYYGNNYQPDQPTQGICPAGWHVPSGGDTGEFNILNLTAGASGSIFWQPQGSWRGVYAGLIYSDSELEDQDLFGEYWSSTQGSYYDDDNYYASTILIENGYGEEIDDEDKDDGASVRCIKDGCQSDTLPSENGCVSPRTIISHCESSDGKKCTQCDNGYSLQNNACVQQPNCTAANGISCTACENGYELANDACVIPVKTMQTFSVADCDALATPSATLFTQGPHLTDERDGKVYEIRKFADGKCWMVDNLRFGGTTDACVSKTTFDGCGDESYDEDNYECDGGANKSGSAWGYGDCQDAAAVADVELSTCNKTTGCGYFYNWQAAIQHPDGYYGKNFQPLEPTQGICPAGWHVPSGDYGGEFSNLDRANGGVGDYDYYDDEGACNTPACDFWQPENAWKGVNFTAGNSDQGAYTWTSLWSSSQDDSDEAHQFAYWMIEGFYEELRVGTFYTDKNQRAAVRCVKDEWECLPGCTSCDASNACLSCQQGYLPTENGCVPVAEAGENCTNSDGQECTACVSGFNLVNGACVMVENCEVSNGMICTQCEEGYAITNDGKCVMPSGTMQTFSVVDCESLATPAATLFTQGPYLTDERDGKVYEVRKFADGKCWMVDNLRYGGATDGGSDYCVGKATFRYANSISNASPIATNGLNPTDGSRNIWAGNCRDPAADNDNFDSPCYNSTACGYYYNWPAAIQDPRGYYEEPFQPLEPTAGICPAGWHLPSGGREGEFAILDKANGMNGFYRECNTVEGACDFWRVGGDFKSLYFGYVASNSSGATTSYLYGQGSTGYFWTSSQYSLNSAYNVEIRPMSIVPGTEIYSKDDGMPVRCVKNEAECLPGCNACNAENACLSCQPGYLPTATGCVQAPTEVDSCEVSDGIKCTGCAIGYGLTVDGTCVAAMGTMQAFTVDDCTALATPTGTDFTQGPYLRDERDGKVYEIRKFSDGNCWMVNNLRYGGGNDDLADYCAGKTAIRSATSVTSAAAVATNGLNPTDGSRNTLVGDCRDAAEGAATWSPCYGSTTCGYYYNWPAAIQDVNGHYYSSFQPSEPTTGICPVGWHLPSGDMGGEFNILHLAAGVPTTGFWQTGENWLGVRSGYSTDTGGLSSQGSYGYYWSSTSASTNYANSLQFQTDSVSPYYTSAVKDGGRTVRCVKDGCQPGSLLENGSCAPMVEIILNCVSSNGQKCTMCESGYSLQNNTCVAQPYCTTTNGISCTACESGYELANDACVIPAETMQAFSATDCAALPTPSANSFTQGPHLTDDRDGKVYEIRKFADGKCWMVDSLRFGGETDACAGKTTFDGDADLSGNAWGYGECQDPAVDAEMSSPCYNSTSCGYYYNWQAAIQNSDGTNREYFQPTEPAQGICPVGWHVPSGNDEGKYTGEFAHLDRANGGSGYNDYYYYQEEGYCDGNSCDFWKLGGAWKGLSPNYISGAYRSYFWSSTQNGGNSAYQLSYANVAAWVHSLYPGDRSSVKGGSAMVRCVKNAQECLPGCTSCSATNACMSCAQEGYLPTANGCVPTEALVPNCAVSNRQACTACESGFNLVNGACVAVTNCTVSDGVRCTACEAGYGITNEGECVVPTETMQEFTADDCQALATPAANQFTQGPHLRDERDGKIYEVRKFADGKCWMVDNLRYGGGTDGAADYCVERSSFRSATTLTSASAVATNGLNPTDGSRNTLVGDCRDPAANNNLGYVSPCYKSMTCGYYYNWSAAIQDTSGYYNNSFQPTESTEGICPAGWHLPSGGNEGEFATLDKANGGTGIYRNYCTTASCNFWRPGNSFKGVYAGYLSSTSYLYSQGSTEYLWSSSRYPTSASYAYDIEVSNNSVTNSVTPGTEYLAKNGGMPVRCVKNETECLPGCNSCNETNACVSCREQNYLPTATGCMPVEEAGQNCTASDGKACTTCENGYTLAGGVCIATAHCAASNGIKCTVCELGYGLSETGECAAPAETMQEFSVADCAALATPAINAFTQGPYLQDERDGKVYEVRKFADGQCWMVDNLRYGGGTDGTSDYCAGKSDWQSATSLANATATATNGLNPLDGLRNTLVGECADATASATLSSPCYNSTSCGYYYNWAAAIQDARGYYNYTFQPLESAVGICPAGWHLPSGGAAGEVAALDIANGGTGAYRYSCYTDSCYFWRPGNSFKGYYAGHISQDGIIYSQGATEQLWTSGQYTAMSARNASFSSSNTVQPGTTYTSKSYGFPVRCVKNNFECLPGCTACNAENACMSCLPGYLPTATGCVPAATAQPNCAASDGQVCTACENTFSLANGACTAVANCATSDGQKCTACEAGHFLTEAGDCPAPAGMMQSWDDCASLATPSAALFTQGPFLIDERDGKVYEVRKFADGQCWMADNLAYGGGTDGTSDYCVSKTDWRSADGITYTAATATNGLNPTDDSRNTLVGECRNPAVDATGTSPCYNSTDCGYYYNWAAAIQDVRAHTNNSFQPRESTVGICPAGWHLPSGGTEGEVATLDKANGGTGVYRGNCYTAACHFWRPGRSFKGVYSGYTNATGTVYSQGTTGLLWTSSEYTTPSARDVSYAGNYLYPGTDYDTKSYGQPVRCVKNNWECLPGCTACSAESACLSCSPGYLPTENGCVAPETIGANCIASNDGIQCTACEAGYGLSETGECIAPTGTMQTFSVADCAALATPTGTDFTAGPFLSDERDGKVYEVRKFADGQCWMADNLRYGGGDDGVSDYCAGKTDFRYANSAANTAATATNGLNPTDDSRTALLGDCRDPAADTSFISPCYNSTSCGYSYNWPAAVQDTEARYGNLIQPTQPTTGICPAGWHLPIGNTAGDFMAMRLEVGLSERAFWLPSGNWKGVLSGLTLSSSASSGSTSGQGASAYYWSSTRATSSTEAYGMSTSSTSGNGTYTHYKYIGLAVRCIKDACPIDSLLTGTGCVSAGEAISNCVNSDGAKCTMCESGYSLQNNTCVVQPHCTAANGISCTACEPGYELANDACVIPAETMQAFSASDCAALVTPAANGFTQGPYLQDERDGKVYEIRKFADGKCWMVDNLRFGGASDACLGKATLNGSSDLSGSAWGYGECRDPAASTATLSCSNSTVCGYYYNWQAVVQNTDGVYGKPFQPVEPAQGICPAGWHVPTGGGEGEFATLDQANGGTGAYYYTDACPGNCDFWLPGHAWKGISANDNVRVNYWSSTQVSNNNAYDLSYVAVAGRPYLLHPGSGSYAKSEGKPVRCVKNEQECLPGCSSCSETNACLSCPQENYLPTASGCVSAAEAGANCVASNGQACTTCESPFNLVNGTCVEAEHCVSSNGIQCTACEAGYGITNDGQCVVPTGTMQAFSVADCAALATPAATLFTQGPYLQDERDGKVYEVRKFADGKCWMVDNLRYGGGSDGASDYCVSKSTWRSATSVANASATATNGLNPADDSRNTVIGECRDPAANSTDYDSPCYNTLACGYYYNWSAAIQNAQGYYNSLFEQNEPTMGICPAGWHLPSGGSEGEFATLDKANGGTGVYRGNCYTAYCNFWKPGNNFKTYSSGNVNNSGSVLNQGTWASIWTSSAYSSYSAHEMSIASYSQYPGTEYNSKHYGLAVRCVKNEQECLPGCNACNETSACTSCSQENYLPTENGCVPVATADPNCLTTDGQVCTACAPGYRVNDEGRCVAADGVMQAWEGCDDLATPTGTDFTQGPYLEDERDGKVYEVRKFADGKCWMVENLMYGGGSDGSSDYCAGKTTLRSATSTNNAAAVATNGLNPTDGSRNALVGDCRDPRVGCTSSGTGNTNCLCTPGSTTCGYFYNWSAAIQDVNGYRGTSFEPTQPMTGICPAGWHVPTGGEGGEYQVLHTAAGFVDANSTGFWQPGGNWQGVYSGLGYNTGGLFNQGSGGGWWASTQDTTIYAHNFYFHNGNGTVSATGSHYKNYTMAVRCVKGDWTCSPGCNTCSADGTCLSCQPDYLPVEGSCVPAATEPNCTASDGMKCTSCASGYSLNGLGACLEVEGTMQAWDGCDALDTPAANGFTQGPLLADERDNKLYEVRKFADGKCWMAENLRYGGATDNCAGAAAAGYTDAAYGGVNGMASPSNRFGPGTYGNCRNPVAGGTCYSGDCDYCIIGAGAGKCGYFYNWQGAMQLPTAYYNTTVSYPNGAPSITNFHQGICPAGWHLPSGGDSTAISEFAQLDIANGGTGTEQPSCNTASCNFWRPGNAYNGLYTGNTNNNGRLEFQGTAQYVWSASVRSIDSAWSLMTSDISSNLYPGANGNFERYVGFPVRCIKN